MTDGAGRGTVVISINSAWNVFNFRAGLIAALRRAEWRVVVLAPEDGYGEQVRALGAEFIAVPISPRGMSPIGDLKLLWRFWRLLGRVRPDAFLGYTIKPNVWGSLAAQARGVPVLNNVSGLGETFLAPGPLNRLVRLLYRVAFARSRVVFFQNGDDRALFEGLALVDPTKVRLLPGSGIDTVRFAAAPLPDNDERFTFLLVGRLLVAKGVGEFAEAARAVRRRHPAARFQLLSLPQEGRGAIDSAAVRAWQAEGLIELLPPTDDVRPALAAADCVVLPSYREGTPRSLLEAAAVGRPLIATDVPGCREVVHEGENGFLVPARDAAALAGAMERMLTLSSADRQVLGRASRALVECRFAEHLVTDAYAAALDEVAR